MQQHDLAGRRVLLTGAAGTFGRAITARLTEAGARVVGLDLQPQDDPRLPVLSCDVTDENSVRAGVAAAVELLGGLDILINNAGIGGPAPAGAMPGAEVDRQLQINLLGVWRVTAAALPALEQSGGRVVMVASRMAVLPLPLAAAYGVSKRALVAYADALRLECAPVVSVTCVYPSMVASPIHDSTAVAGLSLQGVSRPEPLAGVVDTVLTACTSVRPRRDLPTSRRGRLEFFLGRHAPAIADRVVLRTVADRIAAGAFDGAELAADMIRRHRRNPAIPEREAVR